MTDNDIIKALECLHKRILKSKFAEDVTETEIMALVDAIDLIIRKDAVNKLAAKEIVGLKIRVKEQQAEIEEYKKANILIAQQRDGRDKDIAELEAAIETLETNNHSLCMTLANRARMERAEAIKEFVERLEDKQIILGYGGRDYIVVTQDDINNLLQEIESK